MMTFYEAVKLYCEWGKKMRRFMVFGLFTLILSLLAPGAVCAQSFKIGVVDLQKFQKKSKAFQNVSAMMKKKFDAMQQKIEDERNALIKLEEDFKKQSMMLSLDAQEDKLNQLEKKRRYFKYIYEDLSQEMKDTENDEKNRLGKELEKIVKKIAEKEGFTVIFEKRTVGLIYYNDSVDITDRVADAYDALKP